MPTLAIYGIVGLGLLMTGFLGGWEVRGWRDDAALLKVQEAQTAALQKAAEDARALGIAEGNITFTAGQKAAETQDKIVTKTITLTKRVPVYVSKAADNVCSIGNGFVLLHNAAASGDTADTSISDAATSTFDTASNVRLSDVASTVTVNYGKYHQVANELSALQDWVKQQTALHK